MPTKKTMTKSKSTTTNVKPTGFSDEEKAAAKARVQELKAEARANKSREEGEKAVRDALAKLREPDRTLGKQLDALIQANAPDLTPKTWYGMPAYADKDGKVVCFFQPAQKFNTRYSTLGFNDSANLDDGNMWPVAFALTELTFADESKISALVKKAVR
jgi:uncharacterized protein YdhG (YjbR/CyaY superfamily)